VIPVTDIFPLKYYFSNKIEFFVDYLWLVSIVFEKRDVIFVFVKDIWRRTSAMIIVSKGTSQKKT